ncbi:MAG: hypothetical protein LBS31_10675 [Candidatus Adiutrix sp.]|jgi:hypothetical protein|nr:hypothetical protein [Candidatus Adiutrix sp.]
MRLFDLNSGEKKQLRRLIRWHAGYILLIAAFFTFIYYFGYFKSHPFLRESPIFIYISPLSTFLFVLVSPWRSQWKRAIVGTYERLEGEAVFCLMAALVFLTGFYFYSLLIWGLGALGPSIFYM